MLVERARNGDARSVARLISLVEDAGPLLGVAAALAALAEQLVAGATDPYRAADDLIAQLRGPAGTMAG
jgi:LAO/AO transport system kinase